MSAFRKVWYCTVDESFGDPSEDDIFSLGDHHADRSCDMMTLVTFHYDPVHTCHTVSYCDIEIWAKFPPFPVLFDVSNYHMYEGGFRNHPELKEPETSF